MSRVRRYRVSRVHCCLKSELFIAGRDCVFDWNDSPGICLLQWCNSETELRLKLLSRSLTRKGKISLKAPVAKQQDNQKLWLILSHRSPNKEVVIERRSAASSEDAARIAGMMIAARNRLEHGDMLRVLSSIDVVE